jgi:hypothetical protein
LPDTANSAITRVSLTLFGHNAIDEEENAVGLIEISHMNTDYYAISVTSMKIDDRTTGQFFSNLTLFLLRHFL